MIKLKTLVNNTERDSLKAFYDKLKALPPQVYEVFVSNRKPTRTPSQNRYYWAVVIPLMAGELGYNKDEMHDVFAFQLIPRSINIEGKEYIFPGKTSELTTKEFSEYIDRIKEVAEDMGVFIPEAGQIPDQYVVTNVNI